MHTHRGFLLPQNRNVFVNAIYLYDDKLVIFFNSGDKPVTIDDELLSQMEQSDGFVFGALGSTSNGWKLTSFR